MIGNPSALRRLLGRREFSVLLATILVIAVATIINPNFVFSSDGFRNLLLTPSLLVLLAVAEAIVLVTKNVDLSVSATLGLTAYATGRMFTDWTGVPAIVVMLLGVLLGLGLGVVNGVLVSVAKVPALVITLGTLYVFRGIDIAWAGANRINAADLPASFKALGTGELVGIPWITIIAVIVVAVVAYLLGCTRPGRELYAIGSNEEAAKLYGLRVGRRVFAAFVASGTLAGLAGVLYAARYATVASNAGTGLEMQAIAAAVIGGVAIFGGQGTVVGAAIGAVLLTMIDRALPSIGIQDFWQQAVVGALIIGAIVLDRLLARRTRRRLARARDADGISSPPTIAIPAVSAGAMKGGRA
ncbi:MAG: ABC transporter permease [Microbacteriaceae bacterium]